MDAFFKPFLSASAVFIGIVLLFSVIVLTI
jgi:hypothetical protein